MNWEILVFGLTAGAGLGLAFGFFRELGKDIYNRFK